MGTFKAEILGEIMTTTISILALLYKDDVLQFFKFFNVYSLLWITLITFIVKTHIYLLEPHEVYG